MKPFQGTSEKGVDRSTLQGKVICGYQGWHAAEGDGCGRGWYHWAGKNGFKPGSTNVDLWPDVSELDADERYATAFTTADGKTAEVYSAFNAKTVLRHFKWMQAYGIRGTSGRGSTGPCKSRPSWPRCCGRSPPTGCGRLCSRAAGEQPTQRRSALSGTGRVRRKCRRRSSPAGQRDRLAVALMIGPGSTRLGVGCDSGTLFKLLRARHFGESDRSL